MKLLDRILVEIQGKNLLGEIKYVCLNSKYKQQLIDDYDELFSAELQESGRKANKQDISDYFKLFKVRIVVDENVNKEYELLKVE